MGERYNGQLASLQQNKGAFPGSLEYPPCYLKSLLCDVYRQYANGFVGRAPIRLGRHFRFAKTNKSLIIPESTANPWSGGMNAAPILLHIKKHAGSKISRLLLQIHPAFLGMDFTFFLIILNSCSVTGTGPQHIPLQPLHGKSFIILSLPIGNRWERLY